MKRISLFVMLFLLVSISILAQGGKVIRTTMPCKILQGISEREYSIYLPDNYESDTSRKYPVLYLLHGGGCSNTDWESYGNLKHVADSLIDGGMAKKMIIVCAEANKNNMIWFNASHWKYEDFFFQELIPYIEKTYRVLSDRNNRAVAGFSMGGGASVVYGIHHPEYFCSVYGMSSYLRRQPLEFLKNDKSANWRQQIVEDNNPIIYVTKATDMQVDKWKSVRWFIDCGDDDFTFDANIDLIRAFRQRGIPYQLRVLDGGHDWNYWRPALINAIKVSFK